jgi:hypothetical protein
MGQMVRALSIPPLWDTSNLLARADKASRIEAWFVVFIRPRRLIVRVSPLTSTNLITCLVSLLLRNSLARDLLCRPREVLPPDPLVRREIGSLPLPLDAARCAPPVDKEG